MQISSLPHLFYLALLSMRSALGGEPYNTFPFVADSEPLNRVDTRRLLILIGWRNVGTIAHHLRLSCFVNLLGCVYCLL